MRFYVGADNLDRELANMEPISEMKLIDNVSGRAWQFKHVRSISPGDVTVLFDVQAVCYISNKIDYTIFH